MNKHITKFTAYALTVLAISSALYAPVLAEDSGTTTGAANTKVKYNVTESYVWTVSPEITFTNDNSESDSNQTGTITVSNNVIAYGKKLQISVKGSESDGSFKITNIGDSNTKLTYTIKKDNAEVSTGSVALEVPAGTLMTSQNLTFTLSSDQKKAAKYAGEYSGTATFTATVVDANSN